MFIEYEIIRVHAFIKHQFLKRSSDFFFIWLLKNIRFSRAKARLFFFTTYAGFESAPVSVTTDKLGKVKSRTVSGVKNISYTYKPDGRVESETDAVSNRVKSYTYDEDHRLTGYTDTHGVAESMEYDYESRVSKITETAGGNTVESTYAYVLSGEFLS